MKAVANKRRRFGYQRIGAMLERKGMTMNRKKLYRPYTEEKLRIKRRIRRKRAIGSKILMPVALHPGNAGRWTSFRIRLAHPTSSAFWQ